MRNIFFLAITAIITTFFISGCAATLSETSQSHTTRVKRNMQKDTTLIVEDWDRFWMADEPSRLTPNNM
jgi:hypothetical protein